MANHWRDEGVDLSDDQWAIVRNRMDTLTEEEVGHIMQLDNARRLDDGIQRMGEERFQPDLPNDLSDEDDMMFNRPAPPVQPRPATRKGTARKITGRKNILKSTPRKQLKSLGRTSATSRVNKLRNTAGKKNSAVGAVKRPYRFKPGSK